MTTALGRAASALARGEEEAALEDLLTAWRETRAIELAELVELLSRRFETHVTKPSGKLEVFQEQWLAMARRRRATDLPVLLESMFATTQRSGTAIVEALAKRGEALRGWGADPRFGARLVGNVRSQAFGAMSKGHQPFWREILAQVRAHDDPRSIDAFATISLAKIFRGWNDVAGRIAFLQGEIDLLLAELRARHPKGPPALPKSIAKDVAVITATVRALGSVPPALSTRLGEALAVAAPIAPRPREKAAPGDPSVALLAAIGARGDDDAMLAALLDAWRKTRSPRIGELVDVVSARLEPRVPPFGGTTRAEIQRAWLARAAERRPRDLPRLYRMITRTEHRATEAHARVKAIEDWPPDPRAALGVVENLEEITFYSSSTRPFWTALIASAIPNGDLRAAIALEDLAARLPKILNARYTDLASVRRWYEHRIVEAAKAIRDEVRDLPSLDAATEALCDRIASMLRAEDEPGAKLLAEIHASPDDDGPRQVYADHLLERGDPRGEMITLQMSEAPDPAREEELLDRHISRWLGVLAPIAWDDRARFERGFLSEVWLLETRDMDPFDHASGAISDPIWSTVKKLHLAPEQTLPVALLDHEVAQGIVHLGAYEPEPILALLERGDVRYRSLGLAGTFATSRAAQRRFVAGDRKLRRVRTIELDGDSFEDVKQASWLFRSPIGERLEHVTLLERARDLGPWLTAVEKLPRATFAFRSAARTGGALSFARDKKKKITLAHAEIGTEITYDRLADLLETLGRALTVRVSGRPPTKRERSRLPLLMT